MTERDEAMRQGDASSAVRRRPPDPRRNAYRPDIAATQLRGVVQAPRYVDGTEHQVIRSAVPLRPRPEAQASFDTEALFGERLHVYDVRDGWAWVQLARDGYVGYLPLQSLSPKVTPATHKVRSIGTFVYPSPDIKTPPLLHLSIGSLLAVAETGDIFHRLESGGYVVARHVTEVSRFAREFVGIAERFIGTPYLWGGRTRLGIDCSGLVQISMEAAGLSAPRDSDMQAAEIGVAVEPPPGLDGLQRGDLVFWRGHVGIMADAITLLHANAHHMEVVYETLPEAVERIVRGSGPIVAIRRPSGLGAPGGSMTV